ncbi:OLC1v1032359C1 [Oldenlandia corymbosa var. corymbosa]|uniref:OLC1v1032359C1 n=1 Tax=Oldenlandia corymbosa var. corymbosa TaxID=529605 RepID=A0AAV1CLK8_OLDCO|nr:OLC1v1032359C1 [Oldenlandia corymbosa var. corymbosa]
MVRTPTCCGQVGALVTAGCLRSTKTPRETMTSIPVSPSSCSALEELIEKSKLDSESYDWISIRVGLEFIRTFLEFVCEWSKRYEIVRKEVGDVASGIEAAFEKAGLEFGRAFRKRDAKQLDAVRSCLQEKIELFKPRIRESYGFFFEYAFQPTPTTSSFTPIAGYLTWTGLCRRLGTNASRLNSDFHLGTLLCQQFQDVVAALQIYGENSLYQTFYSESSKSFRFLVEGVAICLAGLLFLWWVDNDTDDANKTIMLSNQLQRIKPTSPQFLRMYIESFSAQWNPTFGLRLSYLVRISLIPSKQWLETLHDGLLFLLRHLCDPVTELSPAEAEELQRSRIVRLICDAASRNYFSIEPHDDERLFQLLQEIELLKSELVMTAIEAGHHIPKATFNSIRKGFRFLQTFLGRTSTTDQDVNLEKLILVFNHIEKLAIEGKALRFVLRGKQIHDDARKCKLVLLFKLTNIHCFLMEQMRCKPSLMFPVKHKIHALHDGLELFYKHISVLSWDKSDAKKLILSCKAKITEALTPICYFFQSNQVTGDTIHNISSLLSALLQRVNVLNSHIQGRYHRSQCSSVNFPKTHPGLGFLDLFWENVSSLMTNLADSIGYSERAQIEAVLRELDSLRSVMEEVGEKRIETPQLKNLRRHVTQVAYQADYVIDRILLVKCDWYHLLWLSKVADEMKLIKSEFTKIMQMNNEFVVVSDVVQTSEHIGIGARTLEAGEVVISLKDQEEIIIDRLQRGSNQRRQVVAVVGMPGIGKTTLARKVYENPEITNYFHRRAWCCVTQHYRRRELLLKILSDIVETTHGIHTKTDDDLVEMLYKSLKGYRGSDGGVKACKVHDMLHNLCLRKAEEENFLRRVNGYETLFPYSISGLDYGHDWEHPPVSIQYEQHRLIIHAKRKHFTLLAPSGAPVRTLLFFATTDSYPRCPYDVSFIPYKFRLLRVLDIESINVGSSFPEGIELLTPLRYLAISGNITSIPSKVAKLWNLETFIVNGLMGKVTLPNTIWKLSSLRHLHVSTHAAFNWQDGGGSLQSSSQLGNLVTLSTLVLSHGDNSQEILKVFPRLRTLGVIISAPDQLSENCLPLPVMDFLTELVSLKMNYQGSELLTCQFSFPLNLNKLSLSGFSLTWDDFSAIGELPNLRVLKLVSISFDSETWDMKDNEFQQLECLKLDSLKLVGWNAYSDHLPNIRRLVLRSCTQLQEVPSCFGESNTLQTIELKWCSATAEDSVRMIQEQQVEYGNEGFKTIINVPDSDSISSL